MSVHIFADVEFHETFSMEFPTSNTCITEIVNRRSEISMEDFPWKHFHKFRGVKIWDLYSVGSSGLAENGTRKQKKVDTDLARYLVATVAYTRLFWEFIGKPQKIISYQWRNKSNFMLWEIGQLRLQMQKTT